MKYLFLTLGLPISLCPLLAEDASTDSILSGKIELLVPPSFYTEDWNPEEKLPLRLPGLEIDEKNLVVNLDQSIKESRMEHDLLRGQDNYQPENDPYYSPIEVDVDSYGEGYDD